MQWKKSSPNQWAAENISNIKWNYFHIFSLPISVDLDCGGKSMENSTYLTLSSTNTFNSDDQSCIYTICSMSPKICRIRFDFTVRYFWISFYFFNSKTPLAEILAVLFVGSEFWQLGFTQCFFMGTEYSKTLGYRGVGGATFHGFIFLWAREDEIFVNFKLGNHKDDWKQEFKQT